MSTVTTPDAIEAHDDSDPYDPAAAYAALQTSVQTAFNRRQLGEFLWADSTARAAQTGMVSGDEGFQSDTQVTYKYNGTAWKAWHTLAPVAFTPTITGAVLGSGSTQNTASYTLSSGRYTVTGVIIFGTSGMSVTGPVTVNLPNGQSTTLIGSEPVRGYSTYRDASASASYGGLCVQVSGGASTVRFITQVASTSYVTYSNLASTVPYTWAASDEITYEYSFLPA